MALNKISSEVVEINVDNYIESAFKAGNSLSDLGWSTYADSAGVNPVDGLGGSPNITSSLNTSSPLSGDADLRIVKDAANRQGQGIGYNFTIENRHLAKVLQISFDAELISGNYESPIITPTTGTYSISSTTCTVTAPHSFVQGQVVNMTFTSGTRPPDGTYIITSVTATTFVFTVASGSGTGNCSYTVPADLRISIIQDPTGTPVVIEPVNTGIQLGIANQRIRHIASFQTHLSITSYRLCVHVSNASTVAYTVDFANFKVWEPTQSIGAVITEPQTYIATIRGGTTDPSKGSNISSESGSWHREGKHLILRYNLRIGNTAGTAGSGTYFFLLPSGLSIDYTNISGGGGSTIPILGSAIISNASGFFSASVVASGSSSSFPNSLIILPGDGNTAGSAVGSGYFPLSTTNQSYGFEAIIPIAGWGSSVAMSSDTGDSRVIACIYNSGTNNSLSNTSTPIRYTNRILDTHNAYNTSTGIFTAPISGIYEISFLCYNVDTGGEVGVAIYKGPNLYAQIGTIQANSNSGGGTGIVQSNAGDQLSIRATSTAYIYGYSNFAVRYVSAGSQVVATSETVSAYYYSAATQTSLTSQINFGTRVYDTHGAVTTGSSWRFTAPMSGKYLVTGFLVASSTQVNISLYKNNSLYDFIFAYLVATSGVTSLSGTIDLLAGEYIDLRPQSSATIIGGTNTTSQICKIQITRIGN